jgi:hypothetical protein
LLHRLELLSIIIPLAEFFVNVLWAIQFFEKQIYDHIGVRNEQESPTETIIEPKTTGS